ncbi:MAG: NAD(P)H-dependent oxidoreductase [Defluviitaleaceae bacterium]|nr:NAD(P)H-dependent oxidoreductase [Defluviitaleaceae bacterium]
MKILILNGSPKPSGSASEKLAEGLAQRLGNAEITMFNAMKTGKDEFVAQVNAIDALVVVFPLYVDGLPSHLLRLLDEAKGEIKSSARVYSIANNGFYEGQQNHLALEMMRHFSASSGMEWGQGLGVGAGGMVGVAPFGSGPMKNIGKALDKMAQNILNKQNGDDFYIQPNFPKFLYKMAAHRSWYSQAKGNGISRKGILRGD